MRLVPSILTRNTKLKLASLGLAVLLWVAVRIDTPAQQTVSNVGVSVVLSDQDWALDADPLPNAVDVRFAGTTRELLGVARERPSIVIPIEQVHSGDTTLVIAREWVRAGDRSIGSVAAIEPSSVRLSFEPLESMTAPFRAQLSGQLPTGLALAGPITTVPRMARIRGPLRLLGTQTAVALERFDLAQVTASTSFTVAVEAGPIQGLTVTPDSVTLVIPVEEEAERVLGPFVVTVVGRPPGTSTDPDSASVRVWGARSLVERVDPAALRVVAAPADEALDDEVMTLEVRGLPELVRAAPDPVSVVLLPAGAS